MSENGTGTKDQQSGGLRWDTNFRLDKLVADSPDRSGAAETVTNATLDEVNAANGIVYPSSGNSSGFPGAFGDFWNSGARNWVLGAAAIGIATLLIVLAVSAHSSKPTTLPAQMTAAQASQAQQLVEKQLADGDKLLAKMGENAPAIAQAHNQVEIIDGTKIVLATRHANGDIELPSKMTVTGAVSPTHYQSLSQLDAKRYVNTLSAEPGLNDLANNSAVIHGLNSDNP